MCSEARNSIDSNRASSIYHFDRRPRHSPFGGKLSPTPNGGGHQMPPLAIVACAHSGTTGLGAILLKSDPPAKNPSSKSVHGGAGRNACKTVVSDPNGGPPTVVGSASTWRYLPVSSATRRLSCLGRRRQRTLSEKFMSKSTRISGVVISDQWCYNSFCQCVDARPSPAGRYCSAVLPKVWRAPKRAAFDNSWLRTGGFVAPISSELTLSASINRRRGTYGHDHSQ